jgi:hypothetical protein
MSCYIFIELVFQKLLFLGQLEHKFRDCNFNDLYICGAMLDVATCEKMDDPKMRFH